jgi:TM2 domain-containing membrane protein YozV
MEKSNMSEKRNLPVFLLCYFLGAFGVHRFYVGKIGTGILQLLTFGGLGVWWFIDLIIILSGGFTDKEGNRIALWVDEPEEQPGESIAPRYAGFWRRFVALIIDFVLIHLLVFPLVVVIGLFAPQHIVVSVPFDLFTTERVVGTEQI